MNLKRISALMLGIIAATAVGAQAKTMEFTIGDDGLHISDDKVSEVKLEAVPYIENERTMVPVRVISEQFGCDVAWDGINRSVKIVNGENETVLTIDSDEATADGKKVKLDAPAVIKNDVTMVPLRFVSENLGMDVQYVGLTNQVLISDMAPVLASGDNKINYEQFEMILLSTMPDNSVVENKDSLTEHAADTLFDLKNFIMAENIMKSNNDVMDDTYKTELKDYIFENKEELYASDILCADYANLVEKEYYLSKYTESVSPQVTDEDAEKYYADNYVRAKHILVDDEDTAKAVLKRIKNGTNFDKLMTEYGTDPGVEQYPDGYTFTYGEMVKEFEDAAFGLEVGKTSGIVETEFGFHIIKREKLFPIDEIDGLRYEARNGALYEYVGKKLSSEIKDGDILCAYTPEELVDIFAQRFELEF